MEDDLKIMYLKGQEIIPFIPALAKLRIAIFKDYPYLYDGNLEYEANYLMTYIKCPESIMVLALHRNEIVGASSAIPLEFETPNIQKPFLDNHFNLKDIFYFGESVLLLEYRGRKIYREFFAQREIAARNYGSKLAAFAAVARAPNDPRRPANYLALDEVWQHFGYEKHDELCAFIEWKEVGAQQQTPKPFIFWLKKL